MIAERAEAFVPMEPAKVTQIRSALGTIAGAHQQPRGEDARDSPVAIGEGVEVGETRHRFCGEVRRRRLWTLGKASDQSRDKSLGLAPGDSGGRRYKPRQTVEADDSSAIPEPSADAGRRVGDLCVDTLQRGERQVPPITVEVEDLKRAPKKVRLPRARRT
jgi:hypothetical protein